MAEGLEIRALLSSISAPLREQPSFRLHRVTCPKCGHTVWFMMDSECLPVEIESARWEQAQRILSEPCDMHDDV